jgi:hypothetical protein
MVYWRALREWYATFNGVPIFSNEIVHTDGTEYGAFSVPTVDAQNPTQIRGTPHCSSVLT